MAKRSPLSKDSIADKAIDIADKGGINALSMRNLAAELGIQAMSLYHHFKTKEELLSYMADKLLTSFENPVADPQSNDWRSIVQQRAIAAKELFRIHPWLPFVIDAQVHSGEKRLAYLNNYLGILRKAGLPIELALKVSSLIDSYIYGYCLQLSHVADDERTREELAEEFSQGFDSSLYPFLFEASSLVMAQGYDAEADFCFGLNVLLDGIALAISSITKSDT